MARPVRVVVPVQPRHVAQRKRTRLRADDDRACRPGCRKRSVWSELQSVATA